MGALAMTTARVQLHQAGPVAECVQLWT